jgi:plastocyanin
MRALSILLAALALVLAAGCGDDDEADGGNVAAPTTPEATEPAEPGTGDTEPPAVDGEAGGAVAIGMKDIRFVPDQATVKVGQQVTWTNNEAVPHNVVADEGADFESDTFGEGGTFSYTPDRPGTIAYVCTIHPGMDGTLTVEE